MALEAVALVNVDKVRTVALKRVFGSKVVPVRTTMVRFENGILHLILRNRDLEIDEQKLCVASKEAGDKILGSLTEYPARFIAEFEKMRIPSQSEKEHDQNILG